MQFKHPELLYALLLLLIPIIVHLFQLRKFQKVAFTNVKFLKELSLQTRKSSQLKKWLTLLTRLLLLAGIIIAFAQPYISNSEKFNTKSETVIYLDNSFSMQAQGTNGTLLNRSVQDIIENIDENETMSLFTNDANFYNTSIKAIKNDLIQLKHSPNQLDYDAVILKGKKAFSDDEGSVKNLVLISDFQQKQKALSISNDSVVNLKLVQLKPSVTHNIAVDSVYISKTTVENLELTVTITNQGDPIESLPVSLFNDNQLIAKSSVSITTEASTVFTIPVSSIFNGKITIEDPNLQYDNELFFNIDKRDIIKVLSINNADDSYLRKLYSNDEFDYNSTPFNALNYNLLETQNLIILNELDEIPLSLITALQAFTNDGGSLLIIPSSDIQLNAYNQLFNNYNLSNFSALNPQEKKITTINFSHPLLANVFDKQIQNFQYPKVNSFYSNSGASILSFEDGIPFLSQFQNTYRFSAALNDKNSNFKNSPLIVPVLYNIGKESLKVSRLYYTVGEQNTIDVSTTLQQDAILTLVNGQNSVIPLQQTFTNKVQLTTSSYPSTSGIIAIQNKDAFLKNISFNYATVSESITTTINDIKSATNVNELWKWFVIFALVFLIIEMLILKFLK